MSPEFPDRLGASRKPGGLGRRLVERDVQGSGVGAKLAVERRLGARFGFGRFAGRIFGRAGHGAYLGRGRTVEKRSAYTHARQREPYRRDWTSGGNGASTSSSH